MTVDLSWAHAEFRHRANLQQFECAPLPYRKAKKLSSPEQHKASIWASIVQSIVRNLEPAYKEPCYLELASRDEIGEISCLYYCEDSPSGNGIFHVFLGVLSVRKELQGKKLGEETFKRFLSEVSSRAKSLGCIEIEITATVHQSNEPCIRLLKRVGWHRLYSSTTLKDCDDWGIRGKLKSDEDNSDSDLPLPLVAANLAEAEEAFFQGEEPTMETAMGSAYLWLCALGNPGKYHNALKILIWDISAWPDLEEIDKELEGFGIAQNVKYNLEDPDIAYVRFIPIASGAARAFASAELTDYRVLTLVRHAGKWFVWGFSDKHFPSRSQVHGIDEQE